MAHLLGVNIKTIQRWIARTDLNLPVGRPRVAVTILKIKFWPSDISGLPRRVLVRPWSIAGSVARGQRPDLKNQRLALEQFCTACGLANVEFIEEIGGGGDEFWPQALFGMDGCGRCWRIKID